MAQYEMYKHRLPLQIKDFAIENLGSSVDENEACECIDSGNNEPSDDTTEIDCSIWWILVNEKMLQKLF